jgi:hypothetical protein
LTFYQKSNNSPYSLLYRGRLMEVKPQTVRISMVLNSIFFPLTAKEAFDSFQTRQFDMGQPKGTLPSGRRAYVSGTIARKGNVLVDVDNQRNLVGVQGDSIKECLEVFEEIIVILKDDFDVNLEDDLNYAELIVQYLIPTESNAFEALQKSVSFKSNKLNGILGVETSIYSYSVVPKGVLPTSKKWFEISISPKLTIPTKAYWVEVVFRDINTKSVTAFTSKLNSTVYKILNVIEK